MSYYAGQRKYALGGKGWTVVVGSFISLSYLKWRERATHQDLTQPHHDIRDDRGARVKFDDEPELQKQRDDDLTMLSASWKWTQEQIERLPQVCQPSLYHVAALMTGFWAYRCYRTFNELMIVRYADIAYQIRRPDVLANKVVALKYLGIGGCIVPIIAIGGLAWSNCFNSDGLRHHSDNLKGALMEPYSEADAEVRGAFNPLVSELASGSFAAFAKRTHFVGKEFSAGRELPAMPGLPRSF